MKRNTLLYVTFFLITLLSVVVRSWNITAPVADWHSFRQTDTASVARRYLSEGIHMLIPRYQDLSNIQSGKDNPEGYRMVEMPIYQVLAVYVKYSIPALPIEVALRIVTIFGSACITFLIGIWVNKKAGWLAGALSALVYAVLPYSVFYGRSILPDTLMTALAFGSIFTLDMMRGKKWGVVGIIVSLVLASLSILVKPYSLFILLAGFPIALSRFRWKGIVFFLLWIGIALLPFLWWREWITHFPEGIPAGEWLMNGNGIRFKGAWFHWLFAVRLGDLILGYWGLIPFGLGVLHLTSEKGSWIYRTLLGGVILYFIVFATGNVQHDYYQILTLPVIAIITGTGLAFGLTLGKKDTFSFLKKGIFFSVCMIFGLMFSWFTLRTYYWINRPEIIEAGKKTDEILPKDAKVIAPYNGDTTFLYQTKRNGWPLGFDIEDKIKLGATHYVTVSPTDEDLETKDLAREYTVIVRNEKFAIIDLTKKNSDSVSVN